MAKPFIQIFIVVYIGGIIPLGAVRLLAATIPTKHMWNVLKR